MGWIRNKKKIKRTGLRVWSEKWEITESEEAFAASYYYWMSKAYLPSNRSYRYAMYFDGQNLNILFHRPEAQNVTYEGYLGDIKDALDLLAEQS